MQILLTERFQKDILKLSGNEQESMFTALLLIPDAIKDPHRHSGLGIRKIHHSGIFEARAGLKLRMVFGVQLRRITLHRIGNHDEIHRYLKGL